MYGPYCQRVRPICYWIEFKHNKMAGDSKGKKKKDTNKSEVSIQSGKSKSKGKDKQKQKSKEASKSPSKTPSKSPTKKQKEAKPKKQSSKVKKTDNQSDVSSISVIAPPAADCVHHKSPFIYYCETCEELICNNCTVYGPHNNHLHRIMKITDAYRSRVYYLSEAIRTNLVDKRDKIIAQLHRLEYRVEEIRFVKNIIARDVRSEYSGVLERLKSHEGVKLAMLSHEVSLAQREVDNINDIGNTFFDLTTLEGEDKEKKISKFLLKSKKMYQAIEYLLKKPDRPLPEIKTQQLPKQIDQTRALIQKALAARQINDFKNQVIFNLSKDLKDQQRKIKQEVDLKADNMIRSLSEQAEGLNEKINRFKMGCYYCGVRLTPKVVNEECESNREGAQSQMSVKVVGSPPVNYHQSRRHFFSRLKGEDDH